MKTLFCWKKYRKRYVKAEHVRFLGVFSEEDPPTAPIIDILDYPPREHPDRKWFDNGIVLQALVDAKPETGFDLTNLYSLLYEERQDTLDVILSLSGYLGNGDFVRCRYRLSHNLFWMAIKDAEQKAEKWVRDAPARERAAAESRSMEREMAEILDALRQERGQP